MKEGRDIAIYPCPCNADCRNYTLMVHGNQAHIKDAPPELIDVATLSIFDLIVLYEDIDEILKVQLKRNELEKSFNKTIKNPKKINQQNQEEN